MRRLLLGLAALVAMYGLARAQYPSPQYNSVGVGTTAPATGNVNVTGQYQVGGSQISAGNLSNGTTGTGSVVLGVAPTITLPNATGLPIAGITGLGTGVAGALATPSNTTGGLGTVGTSGANVGLLNGNNTYSGISIPAGDVFFGSGKPWVDVRSGANSCAAAVGNGTADDHLAIQCQVNYMNTTYGGGVVYLPCGSYFLNGNTITVTGGTVTLKGEGRNCTVIKNTTDVAVIAFPALGGGGGYGGLRDIQINGYFNSAAAASPVSIGNGAAIFIYDTSIFGGQYGLVTGGVDGTVQNSYIAGYKGGVFSSGANFYIRVKMDGPWGTGVGTTYGFYQTAYYTAGVGENHLIHCDLSGTGVATWTISANMDATASNTITTFEGTTFGPQISVQAGVALFSANEFGSTTFSITSGASASVVGNYAISGLTITNAGTLKCAGNIGITNAGC